MTGLLLNGIVSAKDVRKEDTSQQNSFNQGESLKKDQYPAAYNAPAGIALNNSSGTSYYFDASFLYWYAIEQGLDIATSATFVMTSNLTMQSSPTDNGQVLSLDYAYRPGFKVGFGINSNEWMLSTEYTWIRQHAAVSKNAPNTDVGIPIWVCSNWFQSLTNNNQVLAASHISSKWNLGMDLLDLSLGRPFYEGRSLTVAPFGGLRAAWIRQKLLVSLTEEPGSVNNFPPQPIKSHNASYSWALGPRMGFNANCTLPQGFRVEGNFAASLLFTRYTSVTHKENAADALSLPHTLKSSIKNYNCLRPILESGLGIGWGSYLSNQRYHIDFSADYDFSFFFTQNAMVSLMDQFSDGVSGAHGNLMLHGLTLTGRFDF